MKASIKILKYGKTYLAEIIIHHDLIANDQSIFTKKHLSKGELKRKVIQTCNALNLDYEFKTE